MKRNASICSLVGLLLWGAVGLSQDFSLSELRSISDARYFEKRISELESRLEAYEQTSPTSAPAPIALDSPDPLLPPIAYEDTLQPLACDASARPYTAEDRWLQPNAGVYGSAEILLLKWYDTDGDDGSDTSDASRYTLGYMTSHGRSIRARYFEFGATDVIGPGQLEIEQADLEYAGRFSLGQNWFGELSLGGRWASLNNPSPRRYSDTYGPLLGIDLRSELRPWLALYGKARQSFQFGREELEDDLKTFGITELGLGVEFSLETCRREWYARTGVESLYYTSVRDDEEDYGLVGWTFEIGTRF